MGDLVLQKNIRQEQRKGGKMDPEMLGPFKIIKLEGKSANLLAEGGKRKHTVNIDLLTHYFQPEERVPAKLPKILEPSPLTGPSPEVPRIRTPDPFKEPENY